MSRIELRSALDRDVLEAILALVDQVARAQGHPPLSEEKQSQLEVGAASWTGLLGWQGGELAGYAHIRWNRPGESPRAAAELVVHPDIGDGGVGGDLLTEVRRQVRLAGGGTLFVWEHHVRDSGASLPARMGLRVQRELAFMVRQLASAPAVPTLPDGIVLRPYREGVDDEAFLRVNNAAFAGHPENGGWDTAEFARRRARSWFEPDGLILAWRDGARRDGARRDRQDAGDPESCLGFHWTKRHDPEPGGAPVGEVYVLGVHPAAQGLGLGRALLPAGLAHLHGRGCREAILYVDLANAGAVRLYRSEGFETRHAEVCYAEELASSPTPPSPTPSGSSL